MAWLNLKSNIPIEQLEFQKIIQGFVFMCPSAIKREKKNKDDQKRKTEYSYVSARKNSSFRKRGINKNLLTTILAVIRRPLVAIKTFAAIESSDDVETNIRTIAKNTTLSDPDYEIMVYKKRSDMSQAEAIFYYIRNAFAHGSFEVKKANTGKENIYIFESKKGNDIKAQMRLKESTLLKYIDLANKTDKEIRELQIKNKSL